jgi:hypothetical protein
MSEAARLRAQKAYSTDPDYLERMALDAEASNSCNPRFCLDRQTAASARSRAVSKNLIIEEG